jgi:hypothetical protein
LAAALGGPRPDPVDQVDRLEPLPHRPVDIVVGTRPGRAVAELLQIPCRLPGHDAHA